MTYMTPAPLFSKDPNLTASYATRSSFHYVMGGMKIPVFRICVPYPSLNRRTLDTTNPRHDKHKT